MPAQCGGDRIMDESVPAEVLATSVDQHVQLQLLAAAAFNCLACLPDYVKAQIRNCALIAPTDTTQMLHDKQQVVSWNEERLKSMNALQPLLLNKTLGPPGIGLTSDEATKKWTEEQQRVQPTNNFGTRQTVPAEPELPPPGETVRGRA